MTAKLLSQNVAKITFHTTCILQACEHGWSLAAGALDSEAPPRSPTTGVRDGAVLPGPVSPHLLCTLEECQPCEPWWETAATAIRCMHGFVAPTAPFAGVCTDAGCVQTYNATRRRARDSVPELPMRDDPIRFPREIRIPCPSSKIPVLPCLVTLRPTRFAAHAWHEHSGAHRDAWGAEGVSAASVADRPCVTPPAAGAAHFICAVRTFHEWYPHDIPFLTSHWDCAPTAYCRASTFNAAMRNGSIVAVLEEAVFVLSVVPLYSAEQPAVMLERVLRPPEEKTRFSEWNLVLRKEWWAWQPPSLPVATPTGPEIPETELRSAHHDESSRGSERRSLSRTSTPTTFALARVRQFKSTVLAAARSPTARRTPRALAATHERDRLNARANLTTWAANEDRVAPVMSWSAAPAESRVLVYPFTRSSAGNLVLVRPDCFLGARCTAPEAEAAAADLGKLLGCAPGPNLVHTAPRPGSGYDYVFALPAVAPPSGPAPITTGPALWLSLQDVRASDLPALPRLYAEMALLRTIRYVTPMTDLDWNTQGGRTVPLDSAGARWRDAPDAEHAEEEHRSFLEQDEAAGERLRVDGGEGRMAMWAQSVTTAKDVADELPCPPQGGVQLHASLR